VDGYVMICVININDMEIEVQEPEVELDDVESV
jgi:hypothetical protein